MWNYFFRVCVLNRTSVYLHLLVYVIDQVRTAFFILENYSLITALPIATSADPPFTRGHSIIVIIETQTWQAPFQSVIMHIKLPLHSVHYQISLDLLIFRKKILTIPFFHSFPMVSTILLQHKSSPFC